MNMVVSFRSLGIASLLAAGALVVPAVTSVAAAPDHPAPPAGYHRDLSPPPTATVTTEIVTLPAAQCAAMNKALAASGQRTDPTCRAVHQSYGQNNLALPAGTTLATSRNFLTGNTAYAAAAYWYWSWWDQECSIYGCWFWGVSLWEDGVANGSNVWKWNEGCTASGYNTTVTWCGFFYNGGGWPYWAMQFGENSSSCAFINGGPACFGHGQRRWIDDWGNPSGYSYW
jgi:hypothetical protein